MNVEIGTEVEVPFLGIYKSKFLCSAGFLALAIVFDVAPPPPAPPSPVSKLSLFLGLTVCRRSTLLAGEGGGGG
jgi:hypothetical protein